MNAPDRSYEVVTAADLESLTCIVQHWCDRGFYPTGGVSLDASGNYMQAVAKEPK